MTLFKKKTKNRVCVIGLDGVPHSMLCDLGQKGVMPNVQKLIGTGHLHKMKASLPEISSVSWTDFMTGTNPGTHGIFGFTDFKKGSYDLRFPNFLDVKKDTFWDVLGRKNKMSVVINQPSTYPARKIRGILISGFVAIELAKAVYPPVLKEDLERMGYQIDIDTLKSREDHDFLWKDLAATLAGRQKAFDIFWTTDWDYFEMVVTGTDRLQHFLWDAYEDDSHAFHVHFFDYYRKLDLFIAKIVEAFIETTGGVQGLYLLSDHGFTGIKQEVYLNVWLEKEGFLSFESSSPKELREIAPSSKIFAMDPNRIYLNLKSKYPKGSVSESDKQAIKQEITDRIKGLNNNGEKVVREVFDTEAVYSGPHVADGPDLIVLSEYGYDMKGSVKKKETFGRSNLQGMHTWDDAFFWSAKPEGQDLSISDLAGIIMENYG
ncbi:MAG: alkaline phosphatase family protein [Candidatus Aminicenantes bacterium]|nr:alkaline phosphatase family protein [Candidatus Aminicenantes bacterium]